MAYQQHYGPPPGMERPPHGPPGPYPHAYHHLYHPHPPAPAVSAARPPVPLPAAGTPHSTDSPNPNPQPARRGSIGSASAPTQASVLPASRNFTLGSRAPRGRKARRDASATSTGTTHKREREPIIVDDPRPSTARHARASASAAASAASSGRASSSRSSRRASAGVALLTARIRESDSKADEPLPPRSSTPSPVLDAATSGAVRRSSDDEFYFQDRSDPYSEEEQQFALQNGGTPPAAGPVGDASVARKVPLAIRSAPPKRSLPNTAAAAADDDDDDAAIDDVDEDAEADVADADDDVNDDVDDFGAEDDDVDADVDVADHDVPPAATPLKEAAAYAPDGHGGYGKGAIPVPLPFGQHAHGLDQKPGTAFASTLGLGQAMVDPAMEAQRIARSKTVINFSMPPMDLGEKPSTRGFFVRLRVPAEGRLHYVVPCPSDRRAEINPRLFLTISDSQTYTVVFGLINPDTQQNLPLLFAPRTLSVSRRKTDPTSLMVELITTAPGHTRARLRATIWGKTANYSVNGPYVTIMPRNWVPPNKREYDIYDRGDTFSKRHRAIERFGLEP
eukprot:m.57738 g.57738  ORF g.57738 m.57738 type:complete len:564 (-) comp7102_c0_seq1:312-2003(-)